MADKTTNLQLQKIDNTDYVGNFPTIYNNNLDLIDVLNNKQDKLIAGSGITIASDGKTISAETEKPWKTIKNLNEIKSLFTFNFYVDDVKRKSYTINKRFYVEIASLNNKDNKSYSTYYRSNIFEKITHRTSADNVTFYIVPNRGGMSSRLGNNAPSVDIGFNTNSTLTDYNFEIRMTGTGNAQGTVYIGNLIKVNNDVKTKLVEDVLSYETVNTRDTLYFSIKYQD